MKKDLATMALLADLFKDAPKKDREDGVSSFVRRLKKDFSEMEEVVNFFKKLEKKDEKKKEASFHEYLILYSFLQIPMVLGTLWLVSKISH